MAEDFRGHPTLQRAGFNALTRYGTDVFDCELWGKVPTEIGCKAADRPTVSSRPPDHSHLSEAYAVGTADESQSGPILKSIQAPPR